MDPITQAQCKSICDGVFSSQLGKEVVNYFQNLENEETESSATSFISQIRKDLDENLFKNPTEFLNKIREIFEDQSRNLGCESYISMSLLTILQIITDQFEQTFSNANEKPLITELNQFINEFKLFVRDLPNDRKSFISYFNHQFPSTIGEYKSPETVKSLSNTKIFNYEEIFNDIMSLHTDKDFEQIANIIISHETSYTHANNLIEIDLKKCQPETLQLINDYLQTIEHDKKE